MHHYEILVEWKDKSPNILHEKRRSPKTVKGMHRQLENVVDKYVEYFRDFDHLIRRLTVTHTHCS